MRNSLQSVLINVALSIVLMFTYEIVAIGLFFGTKDANLYATILLVVCLLLHFLLFSYMARRKAGLRSSYYYVGLTTGVVMYVLLFTFS